MRDGAIEPQALIDQLGELGYMARPFDPRETGLTKDDREGGQAAEGAGRRGLCRGQCHAAVGLRLVGR